MNFIFSLFLGPILFLIIGFGLGIYYTENKESIHQKLGTMAEEKSQELGEEAKNKIVESGQDGGGYRH